MKSMHTIAFLGDVMLGRGVNEELLHRTPESFWGTTLPILRGTNAVIANLECAVTSSRRRWSKTPKVFYFGAAPAAIKVLEAANIRCVALANNHTLDFCEQGLLDTLRHLDAAGIAHAGAGRTRAEAEMPAIVRLAGLTIGLVSLTDNEPAFAATETRAGTNYLDIEAEREPRARLTPMAAACRDFGADLAVLSLHWGPNMVTSPPEVFRAFARAAIDCGFDLIHGHSAHLFQGLEIYHERPIFYDTGDFIDDYAVDEILRNDWSFIFLVDLSAKRIERLRMVPVRLNFARVDLAEGEERVQISRRMTHACSALGTKLDSADGLLEAAIRQSVTVA